MLLPNSARFVLVALAAMLLGVVTFWQYTEHEAARQFSGAEPAFADTAQAEPSGALVAQSAQVQSSELLAAEIPSSEVPSTELQPADSPATEQTIEPTRAGVECRSSHRIVQIVRDLPILAAPGGKRIGTMPAKSIYLKQDMMAWIQRVSADGKYGKITIPWGRPVTKSGWIPLDTLPAESTRTLVVGDISSRQIDVYKGCKKVLSVSAAVGAAGSPSPTGRFWVTERVNVPANQPYFGSFAFGLSTIQPSPPAGWSGGNQMAIHGTNSPGSIGTAASAGCLRVSEDSLAKLKPYLRLGTPVVLKA